MRGCFDGHLQISYIVNAKDQHQIVPFLAKERSVLFLHSYNARDVPMARLIHLSTGTHEELGRFVHVGEKEALALPTWTYDPMQDAYFVCKHLAGGVDA